MAVIVMLLQCYIKSPYDLKEVRSTSAESIVTDGGSRWLFALYMLLWHSKLLSAPDLACLYGAL